MEFLYYSSGDGISYSGDKLGYFHLLLVEISHNYSSGIIFVRLLFMNSKIS